MKVNKLFEIQSGLDYHIVKEKGLEGQDMLSEKILALQVELGECANEWRGFKFWKENNLPRTAVEEYKRCEYCRGVGEIGSRECHKCEGRGEILDKINNPLLEEYVDCLHFILSIGLDIGVMTARVFIDSDYTEPTTTQTFNKMYSYIQDLLITIDCAEKSDVNDSYEDMFNLFIGLGEKHLGFTWEQIERAYLDKNKINHERQLNGY